MTLQPGTLFETVPKELGQEGLVFGQGDDTVPNVARGQHVQVFAKAAAGAAIITDGNHGREFADQRSGCRLADRCRGIGNIAFESLKEGG
jgi:hypothetical protein